MTAFKNWLFSIIARMFIECYTAEHSTIGGVFHFHIWRFVETVHEVKYITSHGTPYVVPEPLYEDAYIFTLEDELSIVTAIRRGQPFE